MSVDGLNVSLVYTTRIILCMAVLYICEVEGQDDVGVVCVGFEMPAEWD